MIRKVIFAIITGILLITGLTASNSVSYKVFLPIIFRPYERETISCYHYLYDTWGVSPGYVQAWATVEYYGEDAVRLVSYKQADGTTKIDFRWETHLIRPNINPGFDINFLWQNPKPDTAWHGNGNPITVGSAWEAVTHLGGSKGYTIYFYAFPKSNTYQPQPYCTLHPHSP